MRSTLLKATAALMVTLVAWTAQAAPQGPTYTNLVIQGFLKNNLGTAINGSLTTVTMTVNQNGSPVASFAANQTLVVSNGAYSHSLTIPADAFYNGGAGAVTVAVSVPAQTLTNSQTLSFTLNSATVPTAFVAERVAPVNTTDTTIGGSIAVGKVVVLGQDGKLPAVDGGNITNISGSVISGSISSATVPASQLTSGSFPVGVSIPASQITAGALPVGVSIPATQVTEGVLPVGVSIPATQVTAGVLPVGVSLPASQLSAGTLPSNVSVPDSNIYPSVQAISMGAGNITTANGARVLMITTTANVSITTINGCNSGLYPQGAKVTLVVAGGSGAHSVTVVDTAVATATADSVAVSAAANYATAATANGTARGSTFTMMCTTINSVRKWVEIARSVNSS